MFTPARQVAQRAAGLLKGIAARGMVTAADVENKLREKLQASDVVSTSSLAFEWAILVYDLPTTTLLVGHFCQY